MNSPYFNLMLEARRLYQIDAALNAQAAEEWLAAIHNGDVDSLLQYLDKHCAFDDASPELPAQEQKELEELLDRLKQEGLDFDQKGSDV